MTIYRSDRDIAAAEVTSPMRARLAVGIAAVLAVVILLPVAVVVALGAYGSSLGGATIATGPGDAELLVFPSHGLPGSPLKVTGKHWPPRSNVAIQLQRPQAGSDSLSKPLRLAEIITSRRGTFEIDTTIPGSVIPFGTQSVRIQAVGRKPSQPDAAVLSVPFDLDPYPNEITISVVDADTGAASPDAIVRHRRLVRTADRRRHQRPNGRCPVCWNPPRQEAPDDPQGRLRDSTSVHRGPRRRSGRLPNSLARVSRQTPPCSTPTA